MLISHDAFSLYEEQERLLADLKKISAERAAAEEEAQARMEARIKEAEKERDSFLAQVGELEKAEEAAWEIVAQKFGKSGGEKNKIFEERKPNIMNKAVRGQGVFIDSSPSAVKHQVDRALKELRSLKEVNMGYGCDLIWFLASFVIMIVLDVMIGEGELAVYYLGTLLIIFVFFWKKEDIVIKRAEDEIAQTMAPILYARRNWNDIVQRHYEERVTTARRKYEPMLAEIRKNFEAKISSIRPRVQAFAEKAQKATPSWNEPAWQAWHPDAPVAQAFRLGVFSIQETSLQAPMLAPLPGHRSLLFQIATAQRDPVIQGIHSLLLQIIASLPPGKVRFTFIDPVGLGQNAAPFMHLADYDGQLVTFKAWSEPRHIEQRLAELTEHMENVIQKYLRQEYASIEQYNEKAGEIAEPYRVLVVFDFPTNFGEDAFRRLLSIAQNGPRCGVYAIIVANLERDLPHDVDPALLEKFCLTIQEQGKLLVLKDFSQCLVAPDTPPELVLGNEVRPTLFGRIIKEVGIRAREAQTIQVPFAKMMDLFTEQMSMDRPRYAGLPTEVRASDPGTWWKGDATEQIIVPLGRTGARGAQCLQLSSKGTVVHALVVGRTGSGKSTLLHTLITSAAQLYSPEELELYLVDFKQGVEFKIYATEETALPHARVVAIESEREFGLSVLQGLEAEHQRRSELFKATTARLGTRVENIAEYRRATGEKLPRILLIVDEFQVFFMEDDPIAGEAARILDFLVRQGRSSGIHILLSTQSLSGSYNLSRSTIDQMAVRIALQCSEADSRLILADDNPAARLLSRPGEAIYNDANGLVEGNHPFQVAWLPDDERVTYLRQIRNLAQERDYRPPRPMIVFEGNAPARVEQNRPLEDLLTAPAWPRELRRFEAWLGEPIAIADPLAAPFRRQSGSNLLIVGQRDDHAAGMMLTALMSLAAQHAPDSNLGIPARFYILDFGAVDAPYADQWKLWADRVPHLVHLGRRRELPPLIAEVAQEVEQRLEDEARAATESELYLVVFGLQRARDLRAEEDMGFSFSSFEDEPAAPSPAQQFVTIVREGPDVGVHVLAWCDTVRSLNRTLDRRTQQEFIMRCAFQMGAEDSAALLDTPLAAKLGPYRAFFYDEDEARLVKFRPYGHPPDTWLQRAGEQLRARVREHLGGDGHRVDIVKD